ncbi:MAG: aminoglycoside phosphotransferase family protein, partial [Mycobacteriales bacterium]
MDWPPPRVVTLVLCTRDGRVLGTLPPFEVTYPWWQDSLAVVPAARQQYAVDVTILRVIDTGGSAGPPGGPVTYLAEVDAVPAVPLQPWRGADPIAEQPNRLPYARPGGPAADVAWADAELARLGRPRIADAMQMRSWNLSSIWQLPTAAGPAWLKVVPRFFAHEGPMLELLARPGAAVVPRLLAYDGCRILMEDIAGEDRYDAPLPERLVMVTMLVQLQRQWPHRIDELQAIGLPDWRHPALPTRIADTLDRTSDGLDAQTCSVVESLLWDIEQRYADIAACGVPDTLVHGDFHSGNTRGDAQHLVLLDWGDSGIGNP